MSYTDRDLKLLWGASGGKCAFPECKEDLIVKSTTDIIGNICHIVGKSAEGPRGSKGFLKEELHKYDNLILLCPNHHGIVDSDPGRYTIDILKAIKTTHERWVQERLSYGEPWNLELSQIEYVNLPRLSIIAAMSGLEIDFSIADDIPSLHSLSSNLISLLNNIGDTLNLVTANCIAINNLKIEKKHLGVTFSFNDNFRTKKVPGPYFYREGFSLTGNILNDPQIYIRINGLKVVLPIDPKWITTTTAFCDFSPPGGINNFAGLATVKQICPEDKLIIATPLILGIPRSFLDNEFDDDKGSNSIIC